MAADLTLAILHHILVFMLFAMLTAQLVLVRPGLTADTLKRVAGIDRGYGILAVLVFVVGTMRVFWGAKGGQYYGENPWFMVKIALFVAIGLISIWPTIRIAKWARASRSESAYAVPADELAGVRRLIHIQLGLFLLIPAFAAIMARY